MKARTRFQAVGLLLVLSLALGLLSGCGDEKAEVEEDNTALLECQNACSMRMRCETEMGVDADRAALENECALHCADVNAPAEYPAEEVHIACSKEWSACDDYLACVKRVTGYEDGTLYAEFCTAWCAQCKLCMEQDESFSDGMCRHADEGDGRLCLEACQEHIDGASNTCSQMFDMVDPSSMTCEDVTGNSPFDQGC